ncbi:hypothetical protein VE03_04344 [Pseudogymnoascus sp. 23342-1-I1]|nr:hypothetical protein VE03_04344 [Pseudogymnoascus sp. 23342-1-I1]
MTVSRTSPTGDFIDAKIQKISAELAASNDDTAGQTKPGVYKKEREFIILKRQKKAVADDVDEALQRYPTIEDAYSSAILTKVISASKKWKKAPEQRLFAKGVLSYYDSVRRPRPEDYVEKYCHLSAIWLPALDIKCVHIIPKSLESDELAYLFGDMDGKALKFLTPNRPARRYLYLRFVMTVLQQQRLGNTELLDYLKERVYLWGLPGPYLRKSMLLALARRFSDQGLLECFYDPTFTVADGFPQRSAEDEDDLAMGLDHKTQDDFAEATRDREDWTDYSHDEWSDDSDTEEDGGDDFGWR